MFEALPIITEGSYSTFVDRELLEVLNNINDHMAELRESNQYLAQAIAVGAETVAEYFTGDTKEMVKTDAVAAMLVVLRLISRELQARQLETQLESERRR